MPEDANDSHWTFNELLSYLESPEAAAAKPPRGAAVFAKAQCIKCHRFGDRGESVGPDLTTVSRRFQKSEILESILFPSQVISDQYASKSVPLKDGASVWGIAAPQPDGSLVILQSDATKITIKKDEIDEIRAAQEVGHARGLAEHADAGRDRRSVRVSRAIARREDHEPAVTAGSLIAYPRTGGDWLILRCPGSKMCLSPSPRPVLG